MINYFKISIFALFISIASFAQVEKEVLPPYNIKTISFVQNGENMIPIFNLEIRFNCNLMTCLETKPITIIVSCTVITIGHLQILLEMSI
jgi:hypothetical protein